ncbi:DUF86 domain-containing protein, partial [Candidatus Pacearchaeota archaeon]|nr:DUF86 domain-containing protein [Candidatus Pacearchaeota archaeon]
SGKSKDDLENDVDLLDSTLRRIEVIGEAVKNISSELKAQYPDVEWKDIIGTRDKLIHAYFKVDMDIVWDVVENELPKLKEQINSIMNERLIK